MKKTLKYLKKYKTEIVLGPLFKLIEATFELFVPLVVASIIDRGIANGDTGLIVRNSLLMILLGILGLAFSVTAQFFCAKAAVGFGADIKNSLFEKIQSLSPKELDRITPATLITRMTSDINSMQNGVNIFLRLVLRSPFIVIGAAIMAFTVDPQSAVWFVIVIPVLSVVVFGIMLLSMPLYKKVQKKLEKVLTLTQESAGGARIVRAFALEEDECRRFIEENEKLNTLQKRVGMLSALMNPVTYCLINAATIALLWTGAVRVDSGTIAVGAVVALFNYMSQILIELIKFATVIISITKAAASADRVEDVLFFEDKESTLPADIKEEGGHGFKVSFEGVTLRYTPEAEPALKSISFNAFAGDTVGIIGGTGSGKTSLIHLITASYLPEEGNVFVDGKSVFTQDKDRLLEGIAIVPQKAVLFRGTVRENLLWGKENATDEEIWLALERAQAADFIREKGGLDAEVS
ncbi:MAG: ABC transporter ATP-binding protein, partial [Clostridia bacterium]|nr:ABC transporter ATP-binding protein [Clostridia bacterium]